MAGDYTTTERAGVCYVVGCSRPAWHVRQLRVNQRWSCADHRHEYGTTEGEQLDLLETLDADA